MDFGLVVRDSIFIHGEDGKYEIQLCFGDITKLSKKDEVDVVLISAFPGSYPEHGTTLMAALKQNLDISVRNLFMNNAEDLRKDFSCWISQPLPEHLPFRRLLCFEQARSVANFANRVRNPDQQLGDVFRAFTTLFSDNDAISVIAPLLSTGGQCQPWEKMMRAMVKSCAAWMRAGMPLKLLKIVVFVPKKEMLSHPENKMIWETFSQLKSTLETVEDTKKIVSRQHDAMFMYSSLDSEQVKKFTSYMKEDDPQLNLITVEIEWFDASAEDEEDEKRENIDKWSSRMQRQMLDVKKVVCFLSPRFLSSKECIDSYNLAMCLSRKWHNSLLAPVYLDTMPYVPTYLTLTQWIDCRKKDRDPPEANKLQLGASHLCDLMSKTSQELTVTSSRNVFFDVFISYSHRETSRVQEFVTALSRASPKLRIFIDKEELKTGFAWQSTLYSALSNSSLVVAFVSESYLKSKMCQEEFAIASSQFASHEFDSQLVTVQLESLEGVQVDPMFLSCPTISTADGDEKAKAVLADFVERSLSDKSQKEAVCHMDQTLRKSRYDFMKRFWKLNDKTKRLDFIGPASKRAEDVVQHVAICCHPEETDRAKLLRKVFLKLSTAGDEPSDTESQTNKSSNLAVDVVTEDSSSAHTAIESADLVLLMLSASFCTQPSTQALLHVAMALSRSGKCRIQGLIMSSLPRRPSVLHLLPTVVNMEDPFWCNIIVSSRDGYPLEVPDTKTKIFWRFSLSTPLNFQLALRISCEWALHCLSDEGKNEMPSVSSLLNIKENGYYSSVDPIKFSTKTLEATEFAKCMNFNDNTSTENAQPSEEKVSERPTEAENSTEDHKSPEVVATIDSIDSSPAAVDDKGDAEVHESAEVKENDTNLHADSRALNSDPGADASEMNEKLLISADDTKETHDSLKDVNTPMQDENSEVKEDDTKLYADSTALNSDPGADQNEVNRNLLASNDDTEEARDSLTGDNTPMQNESSYESSRDTEKALDSQSDNKPSKEDRKPASETSHKDKKSTTGKEDKGDDSKSEKISEERKSLNGKNSSTKTSPSGSPKKERTKSSACLLL